jgi:hypothetical protein
VRWGITVASGTERISSVITCSRRSFLPRRGRHNLNASFKLHSCDTRRNDLCVLIITLPSLSSSLSFLFHFHLSSRAFGQRLSTQKPRGGGNVRSLSFPSSISFLYLHLHLFPITGTSEVAITRSSTHVFKIPSGPPARRGGHHRHIHRFESRVFSFHLRAFSLLSAIVQLNRVCLGQLLFLPFPSPLTLSHSH